MRAQVVTIRENRSKLRNNENINVTLVDNTFDSDHSIKIKSQHVENKNILETINFINVESVENDESEKFHDNLQPVVRIEVLMEDNDLKSYEKVGSKPHCSKTSDDLEIKQNQLKSNTLGKILTCQQCHKTFEKSIHLKIHEKLHEVKLCNSPEKPIKQSDILYSDPKADSVSAAFVDSPKPRKNNSKRTIGPNSVSKRFNTEMMGDSKENECVEEEVRGQIQQPDATYQLKMHKCSDCSKSFTRSALLERHTRIHSRGRQFKCQLKGCEHVSKESDQKPPQENYGDHQLKCSKYKAKAMQSESHTARRRTPNRGKQCRCDKIDTPCLQSGTLITNCYQNQRKSYKNARKPADDLQNDNCPVKLGILDDVAIVEVECDNKTVPAEVTKKIKKTNWPTPSSGAKNDKTLKVRKQIRSREKKGMQGCKGKIKSIEARKCKGNLKRRKSCCKQTLDDADTSDCEKALCNAAVVILQHIDSKTLATPIVPSTSKKNLPELRTKLNFKSKVILKKHIMRTRSDNKKKLTNRT